jgi:Tol biopolymer transport system component
VDLDTEPAWSPGGGSVAFRRSFNAGGSDLFIVPASGGDAVALAMPGEQRLPIWTPDGTRLVFVTHATLNARPDLYSMSANGTDFRPIVTAGVQGGSVNPAFLKRASE